MITSSEVVRTAARTGFRQEIVEKVKRLHGILGRLKTHHLTRDAWLLKGGTALNLLHLDVPRLSVDIDLNFIGAVDADGMKEQRPKFEQGLNACCEREGCSVQHFPTQHAGGTFRLRYDSVFGGRQNLEVDVNYVARLPLFGVSHLATRFPPDASLEVPTQTFEELAAGKFAALVDRAAVRDAFDAVGLLELAPDLLGSTSFRVAFACTIAGGRRDARDLRPDMGKLTREVAEKDLMPLLRITVDEMPVRAADLANRLTDRLGPALASLLTWTPDERRFLDRLLDDGRIDADVLTTDQELAERIRRQPMLQWKAQHVRSFKKLDQS